MKIKKIDEMKKGWFIGNFEPSLYKTNDVEVGLKNYAANDYEKKHFHKIATEYTVVVSGVVRMFGRNFSEGTIIIVEPGDVTDFLSITDSVTLVVKIPGANNDKYMVDEDGG